MKARRIAAFSLCICIMLAALSLSCGVSAVNVFNTKAGEIPPTQFKNDAPFYDDENYPCITHNNRLFVPIELFVGLNNIEYFADGRGSVYLSLNTVVKYISFDSNSNNAFSSVDGIVENVKITAHRSTYVDVEFCCNFLGLRLEQAILNNVLVIRVSDSTVSTDFSDVLEEYVRISDEEFLSPPIVDPDPPEDPDKEVFLMVNGDLSVDNMRGILYESNFRGVGFFFNSNGLLAHPVAAGYAKTGGGSVGIDLSTYTDDELENAKGELETMKRLLSKGSRISTRLVLCSPSAKENSPKLYSYLVENGYCPICPSLSPDSNGKFSDRVANTEKTIQALEGKVYVLVSHTDVAIGQALLANDLPMKPLTVANS